MSVLPGPGPLPRSPARHGHPQLRPHAAADAGTPGSAVHRVPDPRDRPEEDLQDGHLGERYMRAVAEGATAGGPLLGASEASLPSPRPQFSAQWDGCEQSASMTLPMPPPTRSSAFYGPRALLGAEGTALNQTAKGPGGTDARRSTGGGGSLISELNVPTVMFTVGSQLGSRIVPQFPCL